MPGRLGWSAMSQYELEQGFEEPTGIVLTKTEILQQPKVTPTTLYKPPPETGGLCQAMQAGLILPAVL